MTYDGRTKEEKERERQRAHETKLKLLEIMAADPEMKYYLGVAAGAGIAWIASMLDESTRVGSDGQLGGVEGGDPKDWVSTGDPFNPFQKRSEAEAEKQKKEAQEGWAWLGAAALISPGIMFGTFGPALISAYLKNTEEGKALAKDAGLPQTLLGITSLGAAGFSGFCAAILILKAIFGEKGAGEVLKGLTSVGAAVV